MPRSPRSVLGLVLPAVIGILFFGVLMAASMALVTLNARLSPQVPWFAIPVIAMLIGATVWAERRWRIGLREPAAVSAGRATVLALATTVLGISAIILQAAWHGFVREPEAVPAGVSATFGFIYVLVMSGASGLLAEVTFRGIIQTPWHRSLKPWTVIVLVALVNLAAHRWGEWLFQQWLGYLVALGALAWLRWVTGSLWPPLIAHLGFNLMLAVAHSRFGAFDHANISAGMLWVIGTAGVAGAVVATLVAPRASERGMRPAVSAQGAT